MTTCFMISMPTSLPASSSSWRFHPTRFKTLRTVNAIPTPPFNPNDPFLSKLASVAASSPETLLTPSSDKDSPPLLDIFKSPLHMASPAHVEGPARYSNNRTRRPKTPPPDLPSLLLSERIVYIGMPLVPVVTTLVVCQLMYLRWENPKEPVYIYINSTGTTRDDGETVAMETEGFAIYDTMMSLKTEAEIRTLVLGVAAGQACLLLSAGTQGKRYMMPNAKAMIEQPRVPPSGLRPASDVLIHANEVKKDRDTLVELLAKHTGNSEETVANAMKETFYMDAAKAKKFGVIDKILPYHQEKIMAGVSSQDDWGPAAKVDVEDGF